MSGNVVAFDPYNFPNFTPATLENDFSLVVSGFAIYEMIMCCNVYFSVCSKQKMKSGIFQLMTVAVFPLAVQTLLQLFLQLNRTGDDLILAEGEHLLSCFTYVLVILSKVAYYAAGTLRSRALLKRFPKLLFCLYIMLAMTVISNLLMVGFIIHFRNYIYKIPPREMMQRIPIILQFGQLISIASSCTTMFDLIFSNVLIVTFLWPIFSSLDMNLVPVIRTMIKLGDVHRAIIACISTIVFAACALREPKFAHLLAPLMCFWMNIQNTLFLRLSYFTSAELLTKHSAVKSASVTKQGASKGIGYPIERTQVVSNV